jgi:pimeloyl-ACP methyl ester carboxylesterase
MACCVRAFRDPPAVNVQDIEAAGGKWVRLQDGRVVEYFVCGSEQADAAVIVDCPGGLCTGRLLSTLTDVVQLLVDKNARVISVSQPGWGYSSIHPGRRIRDWPKTDLGPVLAAEGVDGDFGVVGVSMGSPHAMAVVLEYGPRVQCMGLRVPYLGLPYSKELGLPRGQPDTGFDSTSLNTKVMANISARVMVAATGPKPGDVMTKKPSCMLKCLLGCLQGRESLRQFERIRTIENVDKVRDDLNRSGIHSMVGHAYNYCSDTLTETGVDPREIHKDLATVLWFAKDDKDCPPSHGAWLEGYLSNVECRIFNDGGGHVDAAFRDHALFFEKVLARLPASNGNNVKRE